MRREAASGRVCKTSPFITAPRPSCLSRKRFLPREDVQTHTYPGWGPDQHQAFTADHSSIIHSVRQSTAQQKDQGWKLQSRWSGEAAQRKCPSELWMSCGPEETGGEGIPGKGNRRCPKIGTPVNEDHSGSAALLVCTPRVATLSRGIAAALTRLPLPLD